ncbi:paired amphipathic helix [Mycena galericulata]|nr:paired amphipathic helix [Mycena galericulata]
MLKTTTHDSTVMAHDTPGPLETGSICHEVVGLHEMFQCICGDSTPGSRHTIKCRVCKLWSHSDCVGNPKQEFTCRGCVDIHPAPLTTRTTDALNFLNAVKNEFPDQPKQYNHFLDIMKEFKHGVIDHIRVIQRVNLLFDGHPHLVRGFNKFLPDNLQIN